MKAPTSLIPLRGILFFSRIIFSSRWLQLPLYFGLIVAQGIYAYRFLLEVYALISHGIDLDHSENEIMLAVLGLIDIVMISNLLIMVIIGGYETFVSRLRLGNHPDRPEWLERANTITLKVKLSLSLISISSIHLLKSFINIEGQSDRIVAWQVVIHLTFIVSALSMAWIDRMRHHESLPKPHGESPGGTR